MLKLRIYNQDGEVRITKLSGHKELDIYHKLGNGEMAEIEIEVSQCTTSHKKKIESG